MPATRPMTVADELKNRGCRNGLTGVLVQVPGRDAPMAIHSTEWAEPGRLVVTLIDNTDHPPESCVLRSKWPVTCCTPSKRNEWNSGAKGKGWYQREPRRPRPPGPRLVAICLGDVPNTRDPHDSDPESSYRQGFHEGVYQAFEVLRDGDVHALLAYLK